MAPVTQATDAGAIEKLVVDAALAIASSVGVSASPRRCGGDNSAGGWAASRP